MIWIIGSEVAGSKEERKARLQYIKDVTGDENVSWEKGKLGNYEFYKCVSHDDIDGVFVTAHNNVVDVFCALPGIMTRDFVVANTCVLIRDFDKNNLRKMRRTNRNVQLFYAKQEPEFFNGRGMVYFNYIEEIGAFGFMTSKSERILYRNRKKGIKEAIHCAFDQVVLEEEVDGEG